MISLSAGVWCHNYYLSMIGLFAYFFSYSANGYGKLRQGIELDVCENDVLVLRIEGFYSEAILEKKLYVPTQLQTDRGSAKFYTILKYLVTIQYYGKK